MSNPRAATSVATSKGFDPSLNAATDSSRSRCVMSPWIGTHAQFWRLRVVPYERRCRGGVERRQGWS
eukprot:14306-Pelagococcus_subviridis.AAC.3